MPLMRSDGARAKREAQERRHGAGRSEAPACMTRRSRIPARAHAEGSAAKGSAHVRAPRGGWAWCGATGRGRSGKRRSAGMVQDACGVCAGRRPGPVCMNSLSISVSRHSRRVASRCSRPCVLAGSRAERGTCLHHQGEPASSPRRCGQRRCQRQRACPRSFQ